MRDAKTEISHYGEYDYLVINDNFQAALKDLKTIINTSQLSYVQQSQFFDEFSCSVEAIF